MNTQKHATINTCLHNDSGCKLQTCIHKEKYIVYCIPKSSQ